MRHGEYPRGHFRENAGGYFLTFSTQKTALSQTHLDGTRVRKSLSQRVHRGT